MKYLKYIKIVISILIKVIESLSIIDPAVRGIAKGYKDIWKSKK